MMMMMAASLRLTLAGVNLWQAGVRSLFKFYQFRAKISQDEAWANVREELTKVVRPETEEWEYQQIRAILYEDYNATVDDAEEMYKKYPDSAPLIDALRACISKI